MNSEPGTCALSAGWGRRADVSTEDAATWGTKTLSSTRKRLNLRLLAILAVVGSLLCSTTAMAAPKSTSGPTLPTSAANNPHKLAQDLEQQLAGMSPTQLLDVIVTYKDGANGKHDSRANNVGAVVRKHLDLIGGSLLRVPAGMLTSLLAQDPDIVHISPDRPVKAHALADAMYAVNADVAQNQYELNGNGIGVAVVDSGVSNVSDLSGRIVYSKDFTGQGTTDDLYGHGTHVAGIVAGSGYRSTCQFCFRRYKGVAPKANIINLRALDNTGAGTDSSVIAAIQTAIALKGTYNIRILNLSLGRGVFESYTSDPLDQAVEQAWKSGMFVVVAAGNLGRDNTYGENGYGTITAPGNDPYVITVGAMRTMGTPSPSDDVIATYSSKGPTAIDHIAKPDIVAPGDKIKSLRAPSGALATLYPTTLVPYSDYMWTWSTTTSPYYMSLSGTSMATPMVSGAAALLLQQNPSLTPDQLKARLMKTANKALVPYSTYTDTTTGVTYSESADLFTVGAGYLDIAAALANTDVAPSTLTAQSPSASLNPLTGVVTLTNGLSVIWDSSVVWEASVVYGSSVVWEASTPAGLSNVMGSSVIWDASTQAFSVIWDASSSTAMSVIWDASAAANSVDGQGDCTLDSTQTNTTGTAVVDPTTVTYDISY